MTSFSPSDCNIFVENGNAFFFLPTEDDIFGGRRRRLRWSHSDRLLNAHLFCFLDVFIGSVDNGEKTIYFFFVEIFYGCFFFSRRHFGRFGHFGRHFFHFFCISWVRGTFVWGSVQIDFLFRPLGHGEQIFLHTGRTELPNIG